MRYLVRHMIEPKYRKLFLEVCTLLERLECSNSDGEADKARIIKNFEDWLSANKY